MWHFKKKSPWGQFLRAIRYRFAWGLVLLALASRSAAVVQFAPVALDFAHAYSGDWEYFVGGGVSSFDCNADGMAELDDVTGSLLDRLTHHVSSREMNGDSYRLGQSRARKPKVEA